MATLSDDDQQLLARLLAAHKDTVEHTALLAQDRQRRREAAAELHDAGHSFKWIGDQLGLSAQAVESFLKYRQRRQERDGSAEKP
ncbi:hypothetical protein ACFVBP_10450 [Nocardioides sp. NPDC057764]|uniref:hypothetical protein n=1 Tax=Nocardioides sp. NPDC057764 TaxID=3346243 RepID=UPI00366B68C9